MKPGVAKSGTGALAAMRAFNAKRRHATHKTGWAILGAKPHMTRAAKPFEVPSTRRYKIGVEVTDHRKNQCYGGSALNKSRLALVAKGVRSAAKFDRDFKAAALKRAQATERMAFKAFRAAMAPPRKPKETIQVPSSDGTVYVAMKPKKSPVRAPLLGGRTLRF